MSRYEGSIYIREFLVVAFVERSFSTVGQSFKFFLLVSKLLELGP